MKGSDNSLPIFCLLNYRNGNNVFITFSFSIIICYSIEFFKKTLLVRGFKPVIKVLSGVLLVGVFALTYIANCYLDIDYGFFGCITPAIVSICYFKGKGFIDKDLSPAYDKVKVLDIEMNEEVEYTIVGPTEVDVMNNKISNESPMGMALIGKKKGANVKVAAPVGDIEYKILSIGK